MLSADPMFAQENPRMVQIHTLRLTYIYCILNHVLPLMVITPECTLHIGLLLQTIVLKLLYTTLAISPLQE